MEYRGFRASALAVALLTAGCAGDGDGSGLSQASLEHAREIEEVVLSYEDGWTQGDFDLIASHLDEDEFVFNEPDAVNLDKDEFMGLMFPFIGNPQVGSTDLHLFVGDDEVVMVSQAWGFGGGTSEQNPVVEVDVFTVSDGAITSIRSMYEAEFVFRFTGLEGAEESMTAYASAWSSGDSSQVVALYADDAIRSEPLSGIRLGGIDEIGRDADERFAQRPGRSVTIVEPYVFTSADALPQTFGAMFAVGSGSTCRQLVLVETNEAGEIRHERVYLHTETLGSCDR